MACATQQCGVAFLVLSALFVFLLSGSPDEADLSMKTVRYLRNLNGVTFEIQMLFHKLIHFFSFI